jgi:hypothetical protein
MLKILHAQLWRGTASAGTSFPVVKVIKLFSPSMIQLHLWPVQVLQRANTLAYLSETLNKLERLPVVSFSA